MMVLRIIFKICKQRFKSYFFILKKKIQVRVLVGILAIDKASGLFITGLDDDDYFMSDRIECFISKSSFLDKYVFIC